MATYYELLKAAVTGIYSPEMSYYDRCRADAIRKSLNRQRERRQLDAGKGKENADRRTELQTDDDRATASHGVP